MQKIHVFCVNTHQHVQSGRQNNWKNPSEPWLSASKRAHAQLPNTQLTKTHFNVPYGRINKNGLGANISWRQASETWLTKAITVSKYRGTSLGTTLWCHVHDYCAQYLGFMQIQWYFFLAQVQVS